MERKRKRWGPGQPFVKNDGLIGQDGRPTRAGWAKKAEDKAREKRDKSS